MSKIPCSVEILTHNSGATLRRALESVHEFAEIIIIDGASSDDTRTIAAEFGARIIDQDSRFLYPDGRVADFSGVRNQGLAAATESWFFFLDSDEYCSPELVAQIRARIEAGGASAYWVRRKYVLEGVVIDCAASYPNRSMRFFARASVERFIKRVHERILLREGVSAQDIAAAIMVPVNPDLSRAAHKRRYYIALQVERERGVSWGEFWNMTWRSLALGALYFLRMLRCRFRSGTCLPWRFEDTYLYEIEFAIGLWKDRFGPTRVVKSPL